MSSPRWLPVPHDPLRGERIGRRGVRVNTIVPGLILTEAVAAQVSAEMLAAHEEKLLTTPVGQPEDVANLVVFLASDEARYISGQTIVIDGGMSSHF